MVAPESLELRAREWAAEARRRWPRVRLDADDFARFLADGPQEKGTVGAQVASGHGVDLYLACACLRRDAAAIEELQRLIDACPPLRTLARKDSQLADEAAQLLRECLLVGGTTPPQLAVYLGKGPLKSFVGVIALNIIRKLRRKRVEPIEGQLALETGFISPELELFKAAYADELRAAFAEAVQALSDREHAVLHLYFVERLKLEQIAKSYGVHTSTVCRWCSQAQERVATATRDILTARLRVTPSEAESLIRLLYAELSVHLSSVAP